MPKEDFAKLFDDFTGNVWDVEMLQPLIDNLGVSLDSIRKIGVGINPLSGCYVMPERDDQGKIIGLTQRALDGSKFMYPGSKRGLFYAVNHEAIGKPQYTSGAHNWERVSKELLCPVCDKDNGCLVSADCPEDPGAVICVHTSKGAVKELELGSLHILKQGSDLRGNNTSILAGPEGPVVVVEGFSDTCAAMDLGLSAIGRPSALSGLKLLPRLLKGTDSIIVGDNDAGDGTKGMESTFETAIKVCKTSIKVLPPERYKDLRQWKNQVSLTKPVFLDWVESEGESTSDPDILTDDAPSTIAKTWLDQEMTQDGLPLVRCYHGQWIKYEGGVYVTCDKEEFRGSIYQFVDGKLYPKTDSGGGVTLTAYRPTRAKVSDIIDALSQWCPVAQDPPTWLLKMDLPNPCDLIAFKNGLLDVNAYVNGEVKFYDPTPALFSFNALPYEFDEDNWSIRWEHFYQEIFNGDEDKIELLAQWFGYNCVPDMSYEKLMLCTGRPRSGKGTVLNTLAAMLGHKQCVSTSFQTLCTEFGYQPLMGKLAVLLSDAKVPREREAKAALEKILQVVGGDPIGVRRMHISFLPQIFLTCRFTIAMNDLPALPDHANALEPKLNVLLFENSYAGKEDLGLKRELVEEAKQGKMINFALQGLRSLRKAKRFAIPESSVDVINQLREITTPVTAFLSEFCEIEPIGTPPKDNYHVLGDYMYEVWSRWSVEAGRKPHTKAQFTQMFLTACPSAKTARISMDDGTCTNMTSTRRHIVFRNVKLHKWVYQDYIGVNR